MKLNLYEKVKAIISPTYPSPRQIVAWRLYKCDYEDLNDEKKILVNKSIKAGGHL